MIFQDPYSSLSPRLRVSYQLTEPYRINEVPAAQRYSGRASCSGWSSSRRSRRRKYPHELSGGQARRVGDRARARAPPRLPRRRRADRRARRLGRRERAEPDEGSRHAARPDVPDHHPQSQPRRLRRRPDRRHVPRAARRGRAGGPDLRRARPPVHAGACSRLDLGARPAAAPRRPPAAAPRRDPEPEESAAGVPLPYALRLRAGALARGGARARGDRARPLRRVPLLAAGAGRRTGEHARGRSGPPSTDPIVSRRTKEV